MHFGILQKQSSADAARTESGQRLEIVKRDGSCDNCLGPPSCRQLRISIQVPESKHHISSCSCNPGANSANQPITDDATPAAQQLDSNTDGAKPVESATPRSTLNQCQPPAPYCSKPPSLKSHLPAVYRYLPPLCSMKAPAKVSSTGIGERTHPRIYYT